MPMPIFVRAALLAASTLLFVPCCFANDVDPASESVSTVSTATHGLFSSWFGTRPGNTEPVSTSGDDAETEAPRSSVASHAGDLVVGALGLLGISYRLGGSTPSSGFDCSGMVRYVFQNTIGLDLPRRAEEISRVGTRVDRNELKPGDLVFYKTLRKTFSHVGIYLGNNRFIHAPSAGGAVRVDDMSQSYWTARFNGARRVEP